jgi:hypothetical protein
MDSIRMGPADELGVTVADITAFYEKHWPRQVALSLPGFTTWQFVSPPEQHGRCTACVTLEGSELIGVMGLHERTFLLNGQKRSAVELTTWILAPEAKGKGIGLRMIEHLQDRYEIMLGSGISDEALNIYLRKGIGYWRFIPRFFRIWDVAAVEPYSRISPLGYKLASHRMDLVAPDASTARRIAAAEIPEPDRGLTDKNRLLRDAAYLAWRYDQHPVYAYETYMIGEAWVVLRRDAVEGMTFAHVVELGAIASDMPAVLAFLEAYGREHGLAAMDFTCTSSDLGRHFLAARWFSAVDEPMFAFLSLFHPPELRDPQTTSLIYWSRDEQVDLADLGRLHIVKGDLDMDRPTIAYYEANGIPQV